MSAPYTVLLGSAGALAPGGYPLFTAREGFTTEIRDIVITNNATAGVTSVHTHSPGGAIVYIYRVNLEANTSFHLELRQVVLPGHVVQADSDCASWDISITGYELTGPSS